MKGFLAFVSTTGTFINMAEKISSLEKVDYARMLIRTSGVGTNAGGVSPKI